MRLLFVLDWHRCTCAVWLTLALGGSVSNFLTPPPIKRKGTSKNNTTSEENGSHNAKSSPPSKTRAHSHTYRGSKQKLRLLNSYQRFPSPPRERGSREPEHKPATANNRRKPVIWVQTIPERGEERDMLRGKYRLDHTEPRIKSKPEEASEFRGPEASLSSDPLWCFLSNETKAGKRDWMEMREMTKQTLTSKSSVHPVFRALQCHSHQVCLTVSNQCSQCPQQK